MEGPSPQLKLNIETRNRLNATSHSFCLAKWLQGTLHLHRGLTHSCHHPEAHMVPLEEISANVAALHNTREKIATRKQMMEGERPEGCQYCWAIEDLSFDRFSDRTLKSQDAWAMPFMEEVLKDPLSDRISPRYLEVSFSRACNFKCSYCSPAFSTRWVQDVLQNGQYPGREFESGSLMLEEPYVEETNPYIKAFWEWWPQLVKNLHTFRITGGEPLLSPNTFKVLQKLRAEPAPELSFSVNSNLGVPREKVQKFTEDIKDLLVNRKIKKFDLYTSLEAFGAKAEYIRNGLSTDLFWSNLELVLDNVPGVQVTIMSTFNLMSVTSFRAFLEKLLVFREKYSNESTGTEVFVDISYLRNPSFLAVNVLPSSYQAQVQDLVQFVADNHSRKLKKRWGFFDFENVKMARTLQWMQSPLPAHRLAFERAAFYRYFQAHDLRRNTNFLATFPEMADFWEECRLLASGEKGVADVTL